MSAGSLEQSKEQILLTWTFFAITFLFAFLCYKIKSARTRKLRFPRSRSFVSRQKIILAIQIKDFLVKYSNRPEPSHLPLDIGPEENWFKKQFSKILKHGHYYRPLFSVQKIKEFIFGLKAIENVELCLYSSLEPEIADSLLNKLNIGSCFPQNRRKFCDLDNDDDQKHAILVDQDSRRVIIITPSYDDHFYEDEKYFLVLRPKFGDISFLRDILRRLKAFLESNQDINRLHEELAQFKIQVESDYSDYEL